MQSTHYSCQILMKLNFLDKFSKNTQKSKYMKIPPVGADLFHADESRMDGRTDGRTDRQDRQTNMTQLIAAFRNFAKSPENYTQTGNQTSI
jgi:hypothetical protein